MVMRMNSALGLTIGDQVRTSYGGVGVHTIERIALFRPGEYEPHNTVTGGPTGIAADELVVCLECQLRYPPGEGHGGKSYLNGIVQRGDRWWSIAYDWPAFTAPPGLWPHLWPNEKARLRLEIAPPVIVLRDELLMVCRASLRVTRQLDLFADMFAEATP